MRGYVWASVVFCAVLSGGVPASGALELYGDRAAFEARLTGANKFGFEVEEGFSLGSTVSSLSGGEIQLLGFGDAPPHISDYYVPGPVYYPPGWQPPPNWLFLSGVSSIRFASPQTAVGFDWVWWINGAGHGSMGPAVVNLKFASGVPDQSLTIRDLNSPFARGFLGAFSDDGIIGLDIDPDAPELADVIRNGSFAGIDDLTTQAIPEPGSCVLLVLGSSVLLARRRQ